MIDLACPRLHTFHTCVLSGCPPTWLYFPSLTSFCLLRNQSGILYWRGFCMMVTTRSTWRHKDDPHQLFRRSRSSLQWNVCLLVGHSNTGNNPHLLLSQLSSPFVEINVGLPQDNMGVTSADTLRREARSTFKATSQGKAQGAALGAAPPTLMAVMANAIFLLPSMFVLRTRRMCWNFSGMTRDWKEASNKGVSYA